MSAGELGPPGPQAWATPGAGAAVQEPEPAISGELARLSALPLEDRPAALTDVVRRLEDELDATEARLGGR
jgi:uncharacterized small protein (DUF1192 family)